jgi:spermidine/putrescine transport system permease protein
MLGNVIADQLTKARNWPLASAISMALTAITTAGVLIMINLQRKDAAGRIAEPPANFPGALKAEGGDL